MVLLMTFISISISLKTANILENKSQVFERSNCTITVHKDLYCNELVIKMKFSSSAEISHKIKKLSRKNTNQFNKSLQII